MVLQRMIDRTLVEDSFRPVMSWPAHMLKSIWAVLPCPTFKAGLKLLTWNDMEYREYVRLALSLSLCVYIYMS